MKQNIVSRIMENTDKLELQGHSTVQLPKKNLGKTTVEETLKNEYRRIMNIDTPIKRIAFEILYADMLNSKK